MFDRSEINYLRGRVVELERQLSEERAENRRTERWCLNMLMRRAQSNPVPPLKAEQSTHEPVVIQPDHSDMARLEAIVQQGKELGYGQQEILEGAQRAGFHVTEKDIAEAIRAARVN